MRIVVGSLVKADGSDPFRLCTIQFFFFNGMLVVGKYLACL